MLGHQLASGLYHLAGSPQRQLHAGGLSRRIHPVHKTFARQNGRRGHRHVTFRPDALFQPDGPGTRAWLLTANYRVILEYNCSNYYAMSVGLLADEIAR